MTDALRPGSPERLGVAPRDWAAPRVALLLDDMGGGGGREGVLIPSRTPRASVHYPVLSGLRAGRLGPSHWSSIPRSVAQLCLEDPIETAVLLSLAGVRSILANQWPTLLRDNALRASVLWESEWRASRARPQPAGPPEARRPRPWPV